MGKRKGSRRQYSASGSLSNMAKGRMVEAIVAEIHQSPDVKIERNKRLPPAIGNGKIKREIDVLITTSVAGYEVRLAFECKNEAKPIGSERIESFISKLTYIGIPVECGIYVSASGYTSGAVERAKASRLKILTLANLSKDLPDAVIRAHQSVLYLLAAVTNITVVNSAPETDAYNLMAFFDEDGHLRVTIPDLIWQAWLDDMQIPPIIGEHHINLAVPQSWYQLIDGSRVKVFEIKATVLVRGVMVRYSGNVSDHGLIDATTNKLDRRQITAKFDFKAASPKLTMVDSEADFEGVKNLPSLININVGRFKLPRIIVKSSYWPPSERATQLIGEKWRDFKENGGPDPSTLTFDEIEGSDLATVWEPIWSGHPAGHSITANMLEGGEDCD